MVKLESLENPSVVPVMINCRNDKNNLISSSIPHLIQENATLIYFRCPCKSCPQYYKTLLLSIECGKERSKWYPIIHLLCYIDAAARQFTVAYMVATTKKFNNYRTLTTHKEQVKVLKGSWRRMLQM